MLMVGDLLEGFCNGYFGRDFYGLKRVEAVGADWVVVRDEEDHLLGFASGPTINQDLWVYCLRNEKSESE